MKFDRKIPKNTGYVEAIEIISHRDAEQEKPTLEMYKSVNINKFNQLLGHISEAKTRSVANYYGVKLTREF